MDIVMDEMQMKIMMALWHMQFPRGRGFWWHTLLSHKFRKVEH